MAGYADLLSSLLGDDGSSEINPYSMGGQALLKQRAPVIGNNFWGAFLPQAAQGFIGGAMSGYGQGEIETERANNSNILGQYLLADSPDAQQSILDANPDFTNSYGQKLKTIEMVNALTDKQNQAKYQQELATEIFKKNPDLIPAKLKEQMGLDPNIPITTADEKAPVTRFRNDENDRITEEWDSKTRSWKTVSRSSKTADAAMPQAFHSLPGEVNTISNQAKEAMDLAKRIESQLGDNPQINWAEVKARELIPAGEIQALESALGPLSMTYAKISQGSRPSDADMRAISNFLSGATPMARGDLSKRLRSVINNIKDQARMNIEGYKGVPRYAGDADFILKQYADTFKPWDDGGASGSWDGQGGAGEQMVTIRNKKTGQTMQVPASALGGR